MKRILTTRGAVLASLMFFAPLVWADSIGDIADTLMGPTGIITKIADIACYTIGLVFVLMAMAQYKIHRQSPKLVPLTTPILLLVLGVLALCIPYVTTVIETGKSKYQQPARKDTVLPLPDVQNSNGPQLPLPTPADARPSSQDSGQPSNPAPAPKPRHWAD